MDPTLRAHFVLALAILALCTGCASPADEPLPAGSSGAGGSGASGGAGGSASSPLVGGITVRLVEANSATGASAYTSLLGKFQDGPQPPNIPLELSRREGDCSLLVPSLPSCVSGCPSTALCTEDDVCTPFPSAVNVGTIDVDGLGDAPFSMTAQTNAFAYQPPATLPHPPCVEGAGVSARSDAFSLESTCIAQLEVTLDAAPAVRAGEAMHVSWVAAGVPDISHVHLVLDVAHHGGKKGEIVCDVPDTGSFDIPESLVTELVNLGLAGYPTIVVTRIAGPLGAPEPDVRLTISSPVERLVETGVTSCTDSSECPDGMTCGVDLTCG